MRFDEYFAEKHPGRELFEIHPVPLFLCARDWLETLSGWSVRRETRVTLVQEALDIIYTGLEKKLKCTSMSQIMKSPQWEAMVRAIEQVFYGEVHVYYPTPIEQRRRFMLVRNSIATGVIKDKQRLLEQFKKQGKLKAKNTSEYVITRAQIELLSVASKKVLAQYKASQCEQWEYWHQLASNRQCSANVGANAEKVKPQTKEGKAGKVTVHADAHYKNGASFNKSNGHLKAKGKVGVQANAGVRAYAEGEYEHDTKKVILETGLDVEADLRIDGELDVEYSFAVSDSVYRSLVGNTFTVASLHAEGQAHASVGAHAVANSNFILGGLHTDEKEKETHGRLPPKERLDEKVKDKKREGVHVGLDGKVWIGFTAKGKMALTLLELINMEIGGDVLAGALAQGHASIFIERDGVRMAATGDLFAGVEASIEEKFCIKHPKRNIEVFSLKSKQGVTAGIGIGGELLVAGNKNQVHLAAGAQATAGAGTKLKGTVKFSPVGMKVMAVDCMVGPLAAFGVMIMKQMPYIKDSTMVGLVEGYVTDSIIGSDVEALEVLADQSDSEIQACLAELEAEAEKLYKTTPRVPGVEYGKGPLDENYMVNDETIANFEGNSKTAFYNYDDEDRVTGINDEALKQHFDALYSGAFDMKVLSKGGKNDPIDINMINLYLNSASGQPLLTKNITAKTA